MSARSQGKTVMRDRRVRSSECGLSAVTEVSRRLRYNGWWIRLRTCGHSLKRG